MADLIKPIQGRWGKYIWYDHRYCPFCIICKKNINVKHELRGKKHGVLNAAKRHAENHFKLEN